MRVSGILAAAAVVGVEAFTINPNVAVQRPVTTALQGARNPPPDETTGLKAAVSFDNDDNNDSPYPYNQQADHVSCFFFSLSLSINYRDFSVLPVPVWV